MARSPARACALRRAWSHARKTIAAAAKVSVTPRKVFVAFSIASLSPLACRRNTPAKAAGIDPMQSHFTNSQRTVRRRTWTPPPTGFITIAATRSEDTAAVGLMPKKIRRIGVMSAPPPIPVRPTVKPTMIDARAIPQSICVVLQLPVRSSFTTSPPSITNGTSSRMRTSSVGSPGTAIRSASSPVATVPTRSCHPSNSADHRVALRIACIGVSPNRT